MSDKRLPIMGGSDPERLLSGDSAGVIAKLVEHLESAPDDEVAWLKLGAAYLHIAHFGDAAQALSRAVELDGSVVEARRLYARVLARLRRHDEAVFQLVQAKRRQPRDPQVLHELGVAFYDKRLYQKAIGELERARELAPGDARIAFALGLAHEGQRTMGDAIACYREAVRLDPRFVEARRTLADALAAMGEIADASRELEEALRLDRTNTQIAMNLEVLQNALRELEARRLLGKTEAELERSTLVQKGQLKRRGKVDEDVRYAGELAELWLGFENARIARLTLLLPDPSRAAAERDEVFLVEVVHHDGHPEPANYATAVTLTFLREALGCPMTRASEIYARLLTTQEPVEWGGARVSFTHVELGGETLHGVRVEAAG